MDKELGIYFNWSCNQLAGDSVATDKYLRDNMDTVRKVAARLLRKINYQPTLIYRGIIVQERDLEYLQPHPGFTYLSFTEDLDVAHVFANPDHFMAMAIRHRLGEEQLYSYIAEYTPALEEILFHHKFLEMLPYVKMMREVANIDASTIHEQKEVTILQPSQALEVRTPYYYFINKINNHVRLQQ